MAKKFMYVCLGILALAVAFHLGGAVRECIYCGRSHVAGSPENPRRFSVSPGIYFCEVLAGHARATEKMVLTQ